MTLPFFKLSFTEQANLLQANGIRPVSRSTDTTKPAPTKTATPRSAGKSDAWPVEESTEHFLAEGIPLTERQHQYLGDVLLQAAERFDAYADGIHDTDDTGAALMAAAERHSITDLED